MYVRLLAEFKTENEAYEAYLCAKYVLETEELHIGKKVRLWSRSPEFKVQKRFIKMTDRVPEIGLDEWSDIARIFYMLGAQKVSWEAARRKKDLSWRRLQRKQERKRRLFSPRIKRKLLCLALVNSFWRNMQPTCSEYIDEEEEEFPLLVREDIEYELSETDFLELRKTDKVFYSGRDRRLKKLVKLFREYARGKISRQEYIAKVLTIIFLEG